MSAVRNALVPDKNGEQITSLIEEFQYPKFGPGMMWERARDRVTDLGVPVVMNAPIERLEHARGRATHVVTGGEHPQRICAGDVVSSMPIGELAQIMDPPAPEPVRNAARALKHRDFLTVALVVPQEYAFPDNWIYIHDPNVRVGRIQNFGSWSPYLVKDGRTCLGLEYFVTEGDELWTAPDEELARLAADELAVLGLVPKGITESSFVVRMPKAYPVYDEGYQDNVDVVRRWLEEYAPNVHPVGRNGMHRYNNADHSMMTAMLAVENIIAGERRHDVWSVNVEEDYHEERSSEPEWATAPSRTGRDAPILPRRAGSLARQYP
jgi:protoporphyrinogen oxidase